MPAAIEIAKKGVFSSTTEALQGRLRNKSIASRVNGSTTAAGLDAKDRTNASKVRMSQGARRVSR